MIIDNLGAHMTSHTLTLALKSMVDGVLVSLWDPVFSKNVLSVL